MVVPLAISSIMIWLHIYFPIRDICVGAGWIFEFDDEGYQVVVVPFSSPESDWGDSYEGDDAEAEGNYAS